MKLNGVAQRLSVLRAGIARNRDLFPGVIIHPRSKDFDTWSVLLCFSSEINYWFGCLSVCVCFFTIVLTFVYYHEIPVSWLRIPFTSFQ